VSNPQQPELRRSETVPAMTPDASEAKIDAEKTPGAAGMTGRVDNVVPEDQLKTGPAPHEDQDQPDLDRFAESFGTKES